MVAALAPALGCALEVDYSDTRFRCDVAADCPTGTPCVDGLCQQPGDEGGESGNGGDDDGVIGGDGLADGGAGGGDGVALAWQEQAIGTYDNVTLDDATTATALGGDAGDLYVAVVSLKPRRLIEHVEGLGLTWTAVREQCTGRSTASLAMFWARSDEPVTPGQVSADLLGAESIGSAVISVHRYTGADPDDPVGGSTWGNTTGHDGDVACEDGVDTAAYAWSSMDTGSPGSLVVVAAHTSNYASHEAGQGFVERADRQSGTTSTSAGIAVQEAAFDGPTADLMVSGSWESKPDWAVIAVELRD